MPEVSESKWTPQTASQYVGAALCVFNLVYLAQQPTWVDSFDLWFIPLYTMLSVVWAVVGVMTSRCWTSLFAYSVCVLFALTLCDSNVWSWPAPHTKTRQIIEMLQKSEVADEKDGRI